MRPGKSAPVSPVPALAAVLALALLAVPLWLPLSPAVTIAGTVAACAIALLRRPSRGLRLVVAAVALWLLAGHAGAWLLRGRPLGGFAWVLAVLYVLPLPLIPWFYWLTFDAGGPCGSAAHPPAADAPPSPPRSPEVNSGSLVTRSEP